MTNQLAFLSPQQQEMLRRVQAVSQRISAKVKYPHFDYRLSRAVKRRPPRNVKAVRSPSSCALTQQRKLMFNYAETGWNILLLTRSSRNFLSADMYLSILWRSNLTTLSATSWQ